MNLGAATASVGMVCCAEGKRGNGEEEKTKRKVEERKKETKKRENGNWEIENGGTTNFSNPKPPNPGNAQVKEKAEIGLRRCQRYAWCGGQETAEMEAKRDVWLRS